MTSTWNAPIRILDHGTELAITYDDCIRYHGRTSIGGVALGFRLLQLALADLSPGRVPERAEISLRTAFPGPGLRDAIEMVTRAVSRRAYVVDEALAPLDAPDAPEAVAGRLWFEITIAGARQTYAVVDGAMSEEFVRIGRASKHPGFDAASAARWLELREGLAATIMAGAPEAVLRRPA
ncbi:hypothetical protein [Pinisolibacter sp.]|uniref:hypothetical protein n=1 Tax=Pinisolibacter sp. TaxID=2172024 RepID=UPI002FDE8B02